MTWLFCSIDAIAYIAYNAAMNDKEISTAEAARILKCSRGTVVNMWKSGAFPNAYKNNPIARNSPIRIPLKDVLALRPGLAEKAKK